MKLLSEVTQKSKKNLLTYALGLIKCYKKTFVAIGRCFGISHDSLNRVVYQTSLVTTFFPSIAISLANHYHKTKPGWLIIDDTFLCKAFARLLEGVWWMYDAVTGRPQKGVSIVVLVWGNGIITIPLGFEWLFSKEINPDNHETKSIVAKKLLIDIARKVNFRYLLIDAHYTTTELMTFFWIKKIKFIGKFPKNRKIKTCDGAYERAEIHPLLKLNKNSRNVKVKTLFGGLTLYIAAHKRKNRKGDYTFV